MRVCLVTVSEKKNNTCTQKLHGLKNKFKKRYFELTKLLRCVLNIKFVMLQILLNHLGKQLVSLLHNLFANGDNIEKGPQA